MDDVDGRGYAHDDEDVNEPIHNQPGSQSSPQNFHLPPTLVAHFPALPAPSHPTDLLTPFSTGSTSDLFRAVVKRPNPISLEINGELHSNAADVALQFAAELRVYRRIGKHTGFVRYLGAIEGLGMVLEWVDGPTLLDVLRGPSPLNSKAKPPPHKNPSKRRRIVWYNQLVDALVHLHSFGLNHGDLSLLNIHIETRSDSVKLIDFGRSVSVIGYPCQHLYIPEASPTTPTLKPDKKPPPAVFRPGGAWVEPEASRSGEGVRSSNRGRDSPRLKLFDRSSNSSSKPHLALGVLDVDEVVPPPNPDPPSRPVNHASRLLQREAPSPGGHLGTHMPVTLSRSNRMPRDSGPASRPFSTSPVQTRFHLATSPMSPFDAETHDRRTPDGPYGYDPDDWMQVDAFSDSLSAPSSSAGAYGYAHYSSDYAYMRGRGHDKRDANYYVQSPPHSKPSSRRPSRSPARYSSAATYANSARSYYAHSSSHGSETPPLRSHQSTPLEYGYPDPQYPSHVPPRPPPKAVQPVKPEPIHPGSRPFCAPEILRAPSGSCIDSRTKQWVDPILADAYSLGIILVCMDLCKLVDINNERQKREDGKFPDLSETTIFTELIRVYTRPAAERERITLDKKMEVPPEGDDD